MVRGRTDTGREPEVVIFQKQVGSAERRYRRPRVSLLKKGSGLPLMSAIIKGGRYTVGGHKISMKLTGRCQ